MLFNFPCFPYFKQVTMDETVEVKGHKGVHPNPFADILHCIDKVKSIFYVEITYVESPYLLLLLLYILSPLNKNLECNHLTWSDGD